MRCVPCINNYIIFVANSLLLPEAAILLCIFVSAGMGFGMVILTSFVIVQRHFEKFRAVAAAIAASGLSLGNLCAGPLLTAMLNAFQWRGTLLLMSAMVLNCCVFGALYRPPPTQSPQKDMRQKKSNSSAGIQGKNSGGEITLREMLQQLLRDLTDLSLFSDAPFTLFCFGSLMTSFGHMVFTQHTPSRAVFLGIERRLAYLLPTVSSVASLISRIICGIIANLSCTNRLLQYGVSIITGGLTIILIGNLTSFIPLAVFGAATGFSNGMSIRF